MNRKSIIALALSAAALLTVSSCSNSKKSSADSQENNQPVSPASISFEWQEPYKGKLEEFKASDKFNADLNSGSRFELHDLNGDSTPELIISPSSNHPAQCIIYTLIGGSLTEAGSAGDFGLINYFPELNVIQDEYQGDGFVLGKFEELSGGTLNPVLTYNDNSASASSGVKIVHEINGEDVLLPQYDEAMKPYLSAYSIPVGRKYSLGEKAVEFALYYNESWGAVINPTQREQLTNKLNEIMETAGEDAAFDLCDLNGNELPELIVSAGKADEDQCSIFYLADDQLYQLEGSYGKNGTIAHDAENHVFFSSDPEDKTYWSFGGGDLSDGSYTKSESIVVLGRKYRLNEENVTAALN